MSSLLLGRSGLSSTRRLAGGRRNIAQRRPFQPRIRLDFHSTRERHRFFRLSSSLQLSKARAHPCFSRSLFSIDSRFLSNDASVHKPSTNVDDDEDEDDDERLPFEDRTDEPDADSTEISAASLDDSQYKSQYLSILEERPTHKLDLHYRHQHDISMRLKTQMEVKLVRRQSAGAIPSGQTTAWTATFVCPITSRRFDSGDLPGLPSVRHDGANWYRKKGVAIGAAAARTLDVLNHEKEGTLSPRFCVDDPSILSDSGTEDEVETTTDNLPEVEDLVAKQVEVPSGETSEDSQQQDAANTVKEASEEVFSPTEWVSTDDSDDDDEMVLTDVPVHNGDSASRLIWTATAASVRTSVYENPRMPIEDGPLERLQVAVDLANAWVQANSSKKRQRKTTNIHRVILPRAIVPETVLVGGRKVLSNLAEVNQHVPLVKASVGVERAAEQVLGILCELDGVELDAEIYTLYMKCLVDRNQKVVAERAEAIVRLMEKGSKWNNHLPPKPDMGTWNALIQLWAQVGGPDGRFEDTPEGFKPNRASFLSILSSNTYGLPYAEHDTIFDKEFARECIEHMRRLWKSNPSDDSLRPDAQVYNAPLRWSGGRQALVSRPYARSIPWDFLKRVFARGLRPYQEESPRVVEALAMDQWADEMKSCDDEGVAPDVETYEAIMQAWIRTATREGLDRAQEIAEMLLQPGDSSLAPRLQSFRPIIEAWTISTQEDGLSKVQRLVDLLAVAAERDPALRPDARIRHSVIASRVRALWENSRGDDERMKHLPLERVFDFAAACTNELELLCQEWGGGLGDDREQDVFIEGTSFELVMLAWQLAASASIEAHDEAGREEAIERMVFVSELFEQSLHRIKEIESTESFGPRDAQRFSLQLEHLLLRARVIHAALVTGLCAMDNDLKKTNESADAHAFLPTYLPIIESMIRKRGEFAAALRIAPVDRGQRLKKHSGSSPSARTPSSSRPRPSRRPIYSDQFPANQSPLVIPQVRLSWQGPVNGIVNYLERIGTDGEYAGDVVRLCRLLKDSSGDDLELSRKNVDRLDRLLDGVLPFAQRTERERTRRVKTREEVGRSSTRRVRPRSRSRAQTARTRSKERGKAMISNRRMSEQA